MNVTEICKGLVEGKFTADELMRISAVLRLTIDESQRRLKSQFRIGDRVTSPRFGSGNVTSIGPKNIMMTSDSGVRVRCSPLLLKKLGTK